VRRSPGSGFSRCRVLPVLGTQACWRIASWRWRAKSANRAGSTAATLGGSPQPTDPPGWPALPVSCVEATFAAPAHVGLPGRSIDSLAADGAPRTPPAFTGTAATVTGTGLPRTPATGIEIRAGRVAAATTQATAMAMAMAGIRPRCRDRRFTSDCILMSFSFRAVTRVGARPALQIDAPCLIDLPRRSTNRSTNRAQAQKIVAAAGAVGTLTHTGRNPRRPQVRCAAFLCVRQRTERPHPAPYAHGIRNARLRSCCPVAAGEFEPPPGHNRDT